MSPIICPPTPRPPKQNSKQTRQNLTSRRKRSLSSLETCIPVVSSKSSQSSREAAVPSPKPLTSHDRLRTVVLTTFETLVLSEPRHPSVKMDIIGNGLRQLPRHSRCPSTKVESRR